MKIGLLTTSFPRREGDVPGQFVLGFARSLAARGHTLEVLAPEPRETAWGQAPRFGEVSVHWVPYLRPRALQRTFYGAGVLDNLRADPAAALGLVPYLGALSLAARQRAKTWDAVISHWALPCALVAGALASSLAGLRHLAVLHSADVFLLSRLPLRSQLARRIARADELLFSSRALRARFLALLPALERAEVATRAHVCAMGIQPCTRRFDRALLRERLGLRRMCVLSLGRLIALKGIAHAIEACVGADVTLVVAGTGPEQTSLAQQARRAGADVRFVGELRGADKCAWLSAADAFVLPSVVLPSGRSEGMPTTLVEAMEHGLPVIASDVGGVSDLVRTGENGVLVPAADPRAIGGAIELLRDPEQHARLSDGARASAALYHWSELAPELERLVLGGTWA